MSVKKNILRFAFILAGILLAAGIFMLSQYQETESKHYMWLVETPKGSAFILGSIHAAPKDFYPLPTVIEESFAKSDALVVELDASRFTQEQMDLTMKLGVYPEGESLESVLSERNMALLSELEINPDYYMRLKPWLFTLTIQVNEMVELGYDPINGIDMHFIKQVGDRELIELETFEQQIHMLAAPYGLDEEEMLYYSLKEMSRADDLLHQTFEAWKRGDLATMEKVALEEMAEIPGFEIMKEKLYTERNHAMTKRIVKLLDTPRTYFVVVGSGHMVGDEGIINLLREQGYTVTQM